MFGVQFSESTLCLRSLWRPSWREVCTSFSYGEALLAVLDEAKDLFFSSELNPLSLGDSVGNMWVIRSHSVEICQPHLYHAMKDFKTQATVETQVVRIGNTSLETHQHIYDGDQTLAFARSVVVLVDENGAPRKLANREEKAKLVSCGLTQSIWKPNHAAFFSEQDFITPEEAEKVFGELEFEPRPSDIDGLGHVNNCKMPLFIYDARVKANGSVIRDCEVAFVYDYAAPLFANQKYRMKVFTAMGVEHCHIETQDGQICFRARSLLAFPQMVSSRT